MCIPRNKLLPNQTH